MGLIFGFVLFVLFGLAFTDELGIVAGCDGEADHEGLLFAELLFANVGEGDGARDRGKYFGIGEFGLDFDSG